MPINIYKKIHTYIHTYMDDAKMADDVKEGVENALNVIVSTTGSSGNMKKELKTIIFDTVSTLRKLFVKLIDNNESNNRKIIELEQQVANTNAERGEGKGKTKDYIAEPSSAAERNTHKQTERKVLPPGGEKVKLPAGGEKVKLYSEVLRGNTIQKTYKLTVTSRDNQTADTTKEILKSKINPTEIKVGIRSIKTLRDGRVQIETGSIQEAETLTKSIRDKLGDKMETNIQRPRKPRMKIHNIPEEITTDNIEDTLIAQNPDTGIEKGEITPKFIYETKRHVRNIIIEVSSQTRKKLMHNKVKLGWINCNIEDYLVATRCFRCSRFNHRMRECRGIETCPLCAGNHNLKDCNAQPTEFKCINCQTYNFHHKNTKIDENHSSLDRKCPSMIAIIEKYKRNTDYGEDKHPHT